jgi:alanyl-tRNA synthetase
MRGKLEDKMTETTHYSEYTTEAQIREAFLRFFEEKGHTRVASSPLVPHNDPTLLFVNAGMVQFKDTFLGLEKRPYTRATTAQKCVRAGGKHNDLDTVGRTARHHTFFEMLGNFSFGDYFKEDAIKNAWEFITEVLKLPKDRLYVTVYKDDDEAREIWKRVTGFDDSRIYGMGEKDNFWAMGETGPCGPCSEIFFDRGEKYTCDAPECAMGVCDCDRWMEIWNLVFMQYERDESGKLTPLPRPSIDTGMGLERITSIMQGVDSNYEIPVMRKLIAFIEDLTGTTYDPGKAGFPYRVIADHIRACTFLIADGVIPGNDGRNYVLRRIFRRAVRYGTALNITEPFMHKMVPLVCELMGDAYPEICEQSDFIAKVMLKEEEKFRETISDGLNMVGNIIKNLKKSGSTIFSGDDAFQLYDTYGFPLDLTKDILEENGLELDQSQFEAALEAQRERARAARSVKTNVEDLQQLTSELDGVPATKFTGYDSVSGESKVLAIIVDKQRVDKLSGGQDGYLILDESPFYAEQGGQTGDQGTIKTDSAEILVSDTTKLPNGIFLHHFIARNGEVNVGDTVKTQIDEELRMAAARNHSATHLLQYALRQTLGNHVHQAGSLVTPDRLRFDFAHIAPLSPAEIDVIEGIVNAEILKNVPVNTVVMSKEEAEGKGFLAFFGDKYGDTVRTVTMDKSMELCGGTHVRATGDIGSFKIVSESGIGSGIRRIEAVTGTKVQEFMREHLEHLFSAAAMLKTNWHDLDKKVAALIEENKEKDREIKALRQIINQQSVGNIADKAQEIGGVKVVAAKVNAESMDALRNTLDTVRDKVSSGAIVLAAVNDGKVMLVTAVSKDLAGKRLNAGKIIKAAAAACGGGGGGRPDMAQAGGKDPSKIQEALDAAVKEIAAELA